MDVVCHRSEQFIEPHGISQRLPQVLIAEVFVFSFGHLPTHVENLNAITFSVMGG